MGEGPKEKREEHCGWNILTGSLWGRGSRMKLQKQAGRSTRGVSTKQGEWALFEEHGTRRDTDGY